jgi:hypothetical protein
MLKVIAIMQLVMGLFMVIKFWDYPKDNKVEELFLTNKQKRNRGFIAGFGLIVLGAFIIIITSFFY